MSLPRTGRSLHQRFRSFLSIRIESICFGVPNFDPYRKPRKPIFADEFEECELRIYYNLLHEPSVLQVGRTGKRSLSPKLLHAPRLRFTTDMTLARVMLPSDLGLSGQEKGIGSVKKGPQQIDGWQSYKKSDHMNELTLLAGTRTSFTCYPLPDDRSSIR